MSETREMMLMEPVELDFTNKRAFDGWDYEPVKLAILARAAWWLLTKLGAIKKRFGTTRIYKFREPKASDSINEAVFRAIKDRIRHDGLPEDYAVVMGHETFREMMRVTQDLMPMGSQVFQFRAGPFGYRGEMFNVPVHVIETVKGVALVPRVVIERKA